MPAEMRYLAFRKEEIIAAIVYFSRRRQAPLPPGSVTKVELLTAPALTVRLTIADDSNDRKRQVAISSEQLAAALVMWCINNKVPVPAKATKTLLPADRGVVLAMTMGLQPDEVDRFKNIRPPIVCDRHPYWSEEVSGAPPAGGLDALPRRTGAGS